MATSLVKALMFLLSINLLLYTAGVRVVGSDNADFVNQFINTTSLDAGTVNVAGGLQETLPDTLEESGSGLLDFIDALGAVKRFVYFIVNIIFTPLGLFVAAGMPQVIVLLVGMPLMFALILGMAYFIRSGS
jgi:hypothetical protein